jgi:phosphoglycolate phosphatase
MKYRAVIFDLDGTLLNTLEDLANCMNDVLDRSGFLPHRVEAYKYFVGDGMENLVRRALPEGKRRDEATVAECLAAMRWEYGNRWKERTRPYEGIPQLLDALVKRGIKIAVLSNKPDEFTRKMVARNCCPLDLRSGIWRKASRAEKTRSLGALEIANHLKIPAGDFLYLGDTNTDMQTAVAAHMQAIGVLWGFRGADELLASGAETLIETPMIS